MEEIDKKMLKTISDIDGNIEAIIAKCQYIPGNLINYSKEYNKTALEDMCLEMSSYGKGDIREPFVEIIHNDGSITCDFLYKDYEIFKIKKSLEKMPSSYDNTNQTESSTEQPKKNISYTYIGQLSIPKIKFKRGFVKKESKYNNIEYNVTIAKEADYPDVKNGNFIIMSHSGDAPISFFEPLYKLELGDIATVSYNAKAYYYKLVKTYQVEKTGKIAIYRDYNKKTLTLITCTHDDLTKQSIYIFEQTNE